MYLGEFSLELISGTTVRPYGAGMGDYYEPSKKSQANCRNGCGSPTAYMNTFESTKIIRRVGPVDETLQCSAGALPNQALVPGRSWRCIHEEMPSAPLPTEIDHPLGPLLANCAAAPLKSATRPTPCLRVPPVWQNARGSSSVISNWMVATVSPPHPDRIALRSGLALSLPLTRRPAAPYNPGNSQPTSGAAP